MCRTSRFVGWWIMGLAWLALFGCQATGPVYHTGYDDLVNALRGPSPEAAGYLASLRPHLPTAENHLIEEFDHGTDIGQDYLVLLVFAYSDSSPSRQAFLTGRLAEALPHERLIEGHPCYLIAECGIDTWREGQYETLVPKEATGSGQDSENQVVAYDQYRSVYALATMRFPARATALFRPADTEPKDFCGAILRNDVGNLFRYQPAVEEMLDLHQYRVLFTETNRDTTDVYILYGRLDGQPFGRVYINLHLDLIADPDVGFDASIDNGFPFGDNDLYAFQAMLAVIAEDYRHWPKDHAAFYETSE